VLAAALVVVAAAAAAAGPAQLAGAAFPPPSGPVGQGAAVTECQTQLADSQNCVCWAPDGTATCMHFA
jgi:hypothetical protein